MSPGKYVSFTAGQVGVMILSRFFFQWIVVFAAAKQDGEMLFPATVVGALLLGFRIFDGVTDPLAGRLSDVWISRGKERRSLLWFSFLVPSIGLVLCFLPNHDMPPPLRWTLLSAGLFLFFVGYTFYGIPYWSLVGDYAPRNEPRRRVLSNLLGAGLVIATAIGFVASPILVEHFGYAVACGLLAVLSAGLMVGPFFAAPRDRLKPVRAEAQEAGGKGPPSTFLGSLKIAFQHRRFLGLIALFSGSQMSFTMMTTAAPFIAVQLLGGTKGDVALLLGPLLGVAIPSFYFVPKISARLGWELGMVIASVALAIVYGLTGFVGLDLIGPPMLTAGILFALGGPMVAALLGLEPEGIVSCASERGGEGILGIYMGVFNLFVKTLNGVAIFLAALLVAYSETVGVLAIRLMSAVAGGLLVVGVLIYFCVRPRARGRR